MTRTAFVFPGEGSQRVGMGSHLLPLRPEAADTYRAADEILGIPLSRLCWDGPARDLHDPAIAQPAVFVTSLVTLDTLRARGIRPRVVAGHSLREYTALVAAGVPHRTDALLLVRLRGDLAASVNDRMPGATVAVIGLRRAQVLRLCAEAARTTGRTVEVAGDDEPAQTVVSGEAPAVARLARAARAAGAQRVVGLDTGAPFRTSLLRGIEAEFTEALIATDFRDPRIPLVSSVTGDRVTTAAEAVIALRSRLTGPVRWTEAVEHLAHTGTDTFVEVGPGPVLSALIRRIAPAARFHGTGGKHRLALTTAAFAATPAAVRPPTDSRRTGEPCHA